MLIRGRCLLKCCFIISMIIMSVRAKGKKKEPENAEKGENRQGRIFSLFNIVQFKQDVCASTTAGTSGTCMTGTECSGAGGAATGNCAAGFGVCCVFTLPCSKDAQTVTRNAEFPATIKDGTTPPPPPCVYKFNKISDGLCGGTTDMFTLLSPSGVQPPTVCGNLNGQHMFLETGPGNAGTSGGTATITFNGPSTVRAFKIKVTYYSCSSPNKAPPGCVQYFTAQSGSFQSYNFQKASIATSQLLQSQNYQTCIRRANGFCSVSYSQSSPASFSLFPLPALGVTSATTGTNCAQDYISIPTTSSVPVTGVAPIANVGRYCGGVLSSTSMDTMAGTVFGNGALFQVYTFTTIATTVMQAGYSLNYMQVACT